MIENRFVNKVIIIGIIVVAVILVGLVSFSSDTKTTDDLTSETNVPTEITPKKGVDHVIELTESIAMKPTP